MPTILTHALAGAAIAQVLAPCELRTKITCIAAASAMLPDADVLGFALGVPYDDLFGHRGFTHSLFFAGVLALAVRGWLRSKIRDRDLAQVFACIFAATASHGILDAFTNGGLGVAFFAPFHAARYFFPVRPILVSPIGLSAFLTERGLSVLESEMAWVWPASICVFLLGHYARCRDGIVSAKSLRRPRFGRRIAPPG
jgi:inner membrane protein